MLQYKIRELRRNQRLTQAEFGKLLGVSASTVAFWETGKREPDIQKLKEIAKIFNVTADYLLDNEKGVIIPDTALNNEIAGVNVIEMIGRNGERKTFIVDDSKMKEIESIAEKAKKIDKK